MRRAPRNYFRPLSVAALPVILFLSPSLASLRADRTTDARDQAPLFSQKEQKEAKQRLEIRNLSARLISSFLFKQYKEIPGLIRQLKSMAPDSAEYHYFRGLQLFQEGERAMALLSMQDSVRINPEFDPAWNMLGVILQEADRNKEAEKAFRRAVSASPYDPTYLFNLSSSLYKNGKIAEALEHVNRTVLLKKNFSEAFHLKALILRKADRLEDSLAAFAQAETMGLNTTDFFVNYAETANQAGEDRKALELAKQLTSSRDYRALRLLGEIHMKFGEYGKAVFFLEKLSRLDESLPGDHRNYLYALFKAGRNPYAKLRFINANLEEKKSLQQYIVQITEEESRSPDPRDPIINPGR